MSIFCGDGLIIDCVVSALGVKFLFVDNADFLGLLVLFLLRLIANSIV